MPFKRATSAQEDEVVMPSTHAGEQAEQAIQAAFPGTTVEEPPRQDLTELAPTFRRRVLEMIASPSQAAMSIAEASMRAETEEELWGDPDAPEEDAGTFGGRLVSSSDYIGEPFLAVDFAVWQSSFAGSEVFTSISARDKDNRSLVVNTSSLTALAKLMRGKDLGHLPKVLKFAERPRATKGGFHPLDLVAARWEDAPDHTVSDSAGQSF